MTTTIVDGTTRDGAAKFIYSVGLSEFIRPEIVMVLGQDTDTSPDSGIPGLMASLIHRATALAQLGEQIDNDEVVRVQWCGTQLRLHTVEWHPNFPMPRFTRRYGFDPQLVTQVEVMPDTDA